MKGFGVVVIAVVVVFLFGLGLPALLVKLGALRPPQPVAAVAVVSMPAPTWTPIPTSRPRPTRSATVTLRAAPGQNVVQMFDSLSSSSAVTRFATGLQCVKLSGPHDITESGVPMSFYELRCMGQTGYVNTKWTR